MTLPVCRFLTRLTVLACRWEAPKYWALLDLGMHLGKFPPSCSLGYRTHAGHPQRWGLCRALWEDLDLVLTSSGDIPLEMWGVWLCKWTARDISMVQKLFQLESVHFSAVLNIMVMDIINIFLIILYATPLWWWPLTPLCLIHWTL